MGKGLEEREINLWDMFWAVCLKWRSILVCAVIFAILAGGCSYGIGAWKIEEQNNLPTLEEVEKRFEFGEKETVRTYIAYEDMYNMQLLYNENSALMKLDADGFYCGVLSFYIDNYYEVKYPTISASDNINGIAHAYKTMLGTEQFGEQVREVLQLPESDLYALELIDTDNLYSNITSEEDVELQDVFVVSVYANDKQTCNDLVQLVKKQVNEEQLKVEQQFGKHEVKLIKDYIDYVHSISLVGYQKQNVDALQGYVKNISNMEAGLSDEQILYAKVWRKINSDSAVDKRLDEDLGDAPSVNKKLTILGFVGGAFLAFLVWAFAYIFSSRFRLEDDFEVLYGSKLLGNISVNAKKKKKWFAFIDRFFLGIRHYNKRYFGQDESVDMITANIRIAMRRINGKKVMITGAVCGEDEKRVAELLSQQLKKDGIEICFGSPVLYNSEALERLVETGCVVLVEKSEKSLYQEIAREIEICTQYEISLLGCVVVY